MVSLATGAMALTLLVASVISDRVGRRQMMTASLFAGSLLTLSSAVLPGWHTLLVTRFLTGIALAGIPAVAMAYVAEEVSGSSIGAAMGQSISHAFDGKRTRLHRAAGKNDGDSAHWRKFFVTEARRRIRLLRVPAISAFTNKTSTFCAAAQY